MWRRNSVASAASFYDMFSDTSSSTSGTTSSEEFPGFIPIPLSEMGDENAENIHPDLDPWSQGIGKGKMYQAYRGQLKIAVYVNYGLLTVHVISAKHLRSRCKALCDSYVKMCVVPDQSKRTRCKTETIFDSNSPLYDEKFSFELLPEDLDKRLLITVWHRDGSRNQCEFLGCMTFGIHHIHSQKKTVDGWYYLLTSEVGKKKHLQVTSKRDKLSDKGHRNMPLANRDVTWMEHHTIAIKRKKRGYGFSLSSACPVVVSRVDQGSQAGLAGLQKDDMIIKIDGLNVSRSACESVARIIKHAQSRIVIEIQRPKNIVQNKFAMETLDKSPRQPLCSSTPLSAVNDIKEMDVSPCKPKPEQQPGKRSLFTIEEEESVQPNFETRDYGWLDAGSHGDGDMDSEPRLTRELLQPPAKDYGWVDDGYEQIAPQHSQQPDVGSHYYIPSPCEIYGYRESHIDHPQPHDEVYGYRETMIDGPPPYAVSHGYRESNVDLPLHPHHPPHPQPHPRQPVYGQTELPPTYRQDDPLPDLIEHHQNHYLPMRNVRRYPSEQYVAMQPDCYHTKDSHHGSRGYHGNYNEPQDLEWDSSAEHLVGFGAQTILPGNAREHHYEIVESVKSIATSKSTSSFPSTVSSGYSTLPSAMPLMSRPNQFRRREGGVDYRCPPQTSTRDDSFIGKGGIIEERVSQEDRFSTIPRRKKVSFEEFG